METNEPRDDLVKQLREIERGEAAPWVSYPPMAWWWPLGFGIWTGTYTLTFGVLDGVEKSLSQLLHVVVMLVAVWWMRRVRGTYPTGKSPRELRGPFTLLVCGAVVVALAVWGVAVALGVWWGAGTGVLAAWSLVAAYERSYARASARVRERLG